MPKTHLKREPGSDSDDPEWSDVQAMMQNILVDTFSPVRRDEPVANMGRLLRNYSSRLGGFAVSALIRNSRGFRGGGAPVVRSREVGNSMSKHTRP